MKTKKPYYLSEPQWQKAQEKQLFNLIEAAKRFMYLGTLRDKINLEKAIAKLEGK
jgi:hypothetical protein